MEQKPIRKWNNEQYSAMEGAELIEELNKRTEYSEVGYNSIAELGVKVKEMEETGVGQPGEDGNSVFITYHDNPIETPPATPTGSGTTGGWSAASSPISVWMATKTALTVNDGAWGTPIRIKGADGTDGQPGEPGAPGTVDISPKWVEVTSNRNLLPTDIGKILFNRGATDVVITIPNDTALEVTEDVAFTALHFGAGKIKIKKGTGVSLGESMTKTARRAISVMRMGANNWICIGSDFEDWTSNYYQAANAVSVDNETNATTGITGVTNWTPASVSSNPLPHTGNYCIKLVHGEGPSPEKRSDITLSGLTIGKSYKVGIWVIKLSTTAEGPMTIEMSSSSGRGWAVSQALASINSGVPQNVWTYFEAIGEATTTNPVITVRTSSSTAINAGLAYDTLTVEEV